MYLFYKYFDYAQHKLYKEINHMNKWEKENNKLRERNAVITVIIVWIATLIIIPLLLKLPCIRQMVLYLLSFTNNADYKIAYVEFWGTIVGSFIAIWGALFVQRKIDEKAELSNRRKYACIIYYDLHFAFKDLKDIFDETKQNYGLKEINNQTDAEKFCKVALGRKIYLNPTWIADVAQLNDVLSPTEIRMVYKYYGKLVDIDRALQSGDSENIRKIFVKDICWIISDSKGDIHNDIQKILDKLYALFN